MFDLPAEDGAFGTSIYLCVRTARLGRGKEREGNMDLYRRTRVCTGRDPKSLECPGLPSPKDVAEMDTCAPDESALLPFSALHILWPFLLGVQWEQKVNKGR